ncbi:MAG TPA: hypothetical protein VFV34_12230 [Blastocatellia bacterium]|nr:hypothetical protein [Blastocatellia bacterium]
MGDHVPKRRLWLVEIWDDYRGLFKAFVADLIISGALVGGLQLFHLLVKYLGFSAAEKEVFLKIHYYGNLAAFVIFAVGFVIDIIVFHYRRLSGVWSRRL